MGRCPPAASLVVALLLGVPALAAAPAAESPRPRGGAALHFGDAMFQLQLGEDFDALTRIGAYGSRGRLQQQGPEADLVAAGVLLQLGLHDEAARRLDGLLVAATPQPLRDRAWLLVARAWYARGHNDRALDALARITGVLAADSEGERRQLRANALIRLERFDEAIRVLAAPAGTTAWDAYARFNLGVALVRSNRLAEAAPLLGAVGTLASADEELLALRDRANVALAYAYLQAGRATDALAPLERVRLEGAQSNRALLGLGWARAARREFRAALQPWLALRERNLLDPAVQEALIAIPYAYGELGARGQSVARYEEAIAAFAAETARLDESIARIRSGNLLQDLLAMAPEPAPVAPTLGNVAAPPRREPRRGLGWELQRLPDARETRYLHAVLAAHAFQEGLKNYRDLTYLASTLERWDADLPVFAEMVDARERGLAQRRLRIASLLGSAPVEVLDAGRAALGARVEAAAAADDGLSFATQQQRAQGQRLASLRAALAGSGDAAGEDAELASLRERLRLAQGLLQWDVLQGTAAAIDAQRAQLRELGRAVAEARDLQARVEAALAAAPATVDGFAGRLQTLGERTRAQRARLVQLTIAQERLLADLAVAELEAQKARIAEYELEARFALAGILDDAAQPAPAAGARR